MFVCRVVFFHLYESPKYLVHAGKLQEAAHVLEEISKVNGNALHINIEDVKDVLGPSLVSPPWRVYDEMLIWYVTDTYKTGWLFFHRSWRRYIPSSDTSILEISFAVTNTVALGC